jgi:hypothetical protein
LIEHLAGVLDHLPSLVPGSELFPQWLHDDFACVSLCRGFASKVG